jgi:hypothetical protein
MLAAAGFWTFLRFEPAAGSDVGPKTVIDNAMNNAMLLGFMLRG